MAAKKKGPGRPKKIVEREVPVGVSFVADGGGHIHGTPSNLNRSRGGAYAASSVIERGTVHKIADQVQVEDGHRLCACGCGQQPSQPSSVFMPGHDSKVRSMGKAVKEGTVKLSSLPKIAQDYLREGGMLD